MAYRAKKRIQLSKGKYREIGELVPEAEKWKYPERWVAYGYIEEVKSEAPYAPPKPAAPAMAPEAEDSEEPFRRRRGRPRKSEE